MIALNPVTWTSAWASAPRTWEACTKETGAVVPLEKDGDTNVLSVQGLDHKLLKNFVPRVRDDDDARA